MTRLGHHTDLLTLFKSRHSGPNNPFAAIEPSDNDGPAFSIGIAEHNGPAPHGRIGAEDPHAGRLPLEEDAPERESVTLPARRIGFS